MNGDKFAVSDSTEAWSELGEIYAAKTLKKR